MRQLLLLIGLLFLPLRGSMGQEQSATDPHALRYRPQKAFRVGEKLHYQIRYGIIKAGKATVEVRSHTQRAGRPVYHVVGTGRSIGMAEWFFRTRDRYESFIDTAALAPWEFIRDVDEGGHIIKRHLIFDQARKVVKDLEHLDKGIFNFPDYAQDMFSSFYYARSVDAAKLKTGDDIAFTMFLDHEQFPFRLRLIGRETIKTDFGKVKCLVLRPTLQKGRVFKEEESMTIWVTDDPNKIPILVKSELLVGSIKVELTGFEGLRHPSPFF